MRSPLTKVARFLTSDGPGATWRKARTKLGERTFQGDYRVAAFCGTVVGDTRRVVGVACRVPPEADVVPVHPDLAREAADDVSFDAFADALAASENILASLGRQSYLYSGSAPPRRLVELVDAALAAAGGGGAPIRPAGPVAANDVVRTRRRPQATGVPVALLGAGDYARTEIVPRLDERFERHVVADREPQIAALAADAHDFALATTDAEHAIDALPRPGVVFVATNHDSHATLAAAALHAGHRVFLEKPAVVTLDDLGLLVDAVRETGRMPEIGFNRRYNRLVREARRQLARETGPLTVTSIVKEVSIEPDHWYLWPNQGTRVTGNLCHWLDLGVFLLGGGPIPTDVTASPAVNDRPEQADEERVLAVGFDDGSLVSIVATGRGDDIRGVQEQIDARRGGTSVALDDLWKLTLRRDGATKRDRTVFRDKGHAAMFAAATDRLARGVDAPYPLRDLVLVSLVQVEASRLVRDGDVHASLEVVDDFLTRVERTAAAETAV